MASDHRDVDRFWPGSPPRVPGSTCHARSDLADVMSIRSEHGPGHMPGAPTGGMMRKITQAFAPLRARPTTEASPPWPPSSAEPTRRFATFAAQPDDAA